LSIGQASISISFFFIPHHAYTDARKGLLRFIKAM